MFSFYMYPSLSCVQSWRGALGSNSILSLNPVSKCIIYTRDLVSVAYLQCLHFNKVFLFLTEIKNSFLVHIRPDSLILKSYFIAIFKISVTILHTVFSPTTSI